MPGKKKKEVKSSVPDVISQPAQSAQPGPPGLEHHGLFGDLMVLAGLVVYVTWKGFEIYHEVNRRWASRPSQTNQIIIDQGGSRGEEVTS